MKININFEKKHLVFLAIIVSVIGLGIAVAGTFTGPSGIGHDINEIDWASLGSCASGSSIRAINAGGTVVCETDDSGGSSGGGGGAPGESVMYLRRSASAGGDAGLCPSDWTEIDYQTVVAAGDRDNIVRICVKTDQVCQVAYIKKSASAAGADPGLCPSDWTEADYQPAVAQDQRDNRVRTCYKCEATGSGVSASGGVGGSVFYTFKSHSGQRPPPPPSCPTDWDTADAGSEKGGGVSVTYKNVCYRNDDVECQSFYTTITASGSRPPPPPACPSSGGWQSTDGGTISAFESDGVTYYNVCYRCES